MYENGIRECIGYSQATTRGTSDAPRAGGNAPKCDLATHATSGGTSEAPKQTGNPKITDYSGGGPLGTTRGGIPARCDAPPRSAQIGTGIGRETNFRKKCAQNTNGTSGYLRHISG